MPIIKRGKIWVYIAPDPTPEQLENAEKHGYDPYDRAGALPIWDLSADDLFAAAAVIHDEMYTEGGPEWLRKVVDESFCRDTKILLRALPDGWLKYFEMAKASALCSVVNAVAESRSFWQETSRNTPNTRQTGILYMDEAKSWINYCAKIAEYPIPYRDVAAWCPDD